MSKQGAFLIYDSISNMFRGYKKNSLVVLRIDKDILESVGLMKNMNNVNKTLYIPLYGKVFVSKKGIILNDVKAEEIWGEAWLKEKGY